MLLASQSPQELASLILDYATTADEREVPGLEAALRCILHIDERPAEELLAEARWAQEVSSMPDDELLENLEHGQYLTDADRTAFEEEAGRRGIWMGP